MSNKSTEIAIVLDCSNVMRAYLDHFKKEIGGILETTKKQRNGKVKVALVKYIRKDDDETKVKYCDFTENLHKIAELIPSKHSNTFEPKSLKPTNIHHALERALNGLKWTTAADSSRRILILIGKNPPHGVKYHKLGNKCDKWPSGIISPDDDDILRKLGEKKIDLFMISIERALDLFYDELLKTEHMNCNLKFVNRIGVDNENELIEEIKKSVIKLKATTKKNEEHKMREERVEKDLLGTEKKETDVNFNVAEGDMKWIKSDLNNKWCPVLILSTTSTSARVWNGEKQFTVLIKRLKDRNYDEHDNEAMPIFHKLLQSSMNRQKAYEITEQDSQQMLKNVSNSLRCHSDVKWLKINNRSWYPVLIIQRHPKMFVLDPNNKFREVKPKDLIDEPPYKNSSHVATHVKRLNDTLSNYSWKSPIGAHCSWKDGTGWLGGDNIRTGVIISIRNAWRHETEFMVRPDDEMYRNIRISDIKDKFKILDAIGYKSTMTITNKRLKSMEADNKSLKSKLEREQRFQKQLNTEVRNLKSERNALRNDITQSKKRLNSVQGDNDHLRSRITRNKRDIESKTKELHESQEECSKAITMKQEAERKFKTILNNYDDLKTDAEILRKQKKEQQQLVNKLRDKKIENSSALDFSRGFPPIQDIVRDFGLVKSQYHVEAAKLVKKILKKKNQDYSKLRNYKIASNMLFDILLESFEEMKKFQQEQYKKMSKGHKIDDVNQKTMIEKKMKGTYLSILNEVKKEKAHKIVNEHKKLQELDDYLDDDNILLKYAEECISICWVISLVCDPCLTIEPQVFDQSEDDIEFDEKLHIEGFGSDTEHCLNFVIWPSIVREDTEYNISKMTGVFIEDIPKWNKKYSKKKKQKKKKNEIEQKNEDNVKNEDNTKNAIGGETKTIAEIATDHAPDECANDVNNDEALSGMNDIEKDAENTTFDGNKKDNEYVHAKKSHV